MLPTQVNYPEFVPDQLLTSEHLNQLFGYLEEQGRLTRTNLIGIGIVCGMEVKTNATGTQLTITKGCGVTSEGYLVSIPEVTYSSRKSFNAVQERIYDRFVDGSKNQRFDINELKQAAVEEGTTALDSAFLVDKVVLIVVEILEEGAKNCNPNSCDDKGVNVTVTFRPLLISKAAAESLGEWNKLPKTMLALPDLKLRRYDVMATNLKDTAAVFKAFGIILSESFIKRVEEVFNQAYETFLPVLPDLYASNPFAGLAGKFKFLHDGTIDNTQLLNLQYFYDLFSDLILAYSELQKTGSDLISSCCPDSNLFPRHLLLDLAIKDANHEKSYYRHYFAPSPITQGDSSHVEELRSLFKRLVLLTEKFFIPKSVTGGTAIETKAGIDTNIRITPSKLGDISLSEKSIPFYYKVAESPDPLVQYWNFKKTSKERADQNLSYRAEDYNGNDEHILKPLLYDLEPHNFLRIEGHLGKQYTAALRNILRIKQQHRLPFEVIALSTDVASLKKNVKDLANRPSASGLADKLEQKDLPQCQFQDLESLYDTIAAGLTCSLCEEMKYFYGQDGSGRWPKPTSLIPQVSLLRKCDPDFEFAVNSFGHDFEVYYSNIQNQRYMVGDIVMAPMAYRMATGKSSDQAAEKEKASSEMAGDRIEDQNETGRVISGGNINNDDQSLGLLLLYSMQRLSETIVTDLSEFDIDEFNSRYSMLLRIASQLKEMFTSSSRTGSINNVAEDFVDHLDSLIFACKQAQLQTLHKDYMNRWVYVMMLQKFGYFLKMHPGIQHKAGVSVGGTFILIYHEGESGVEEDSFLMAIDDVFSITGRGTVVTGQIERGEINSGDAIKISGMGVKEVQTTVTGLEMGRNTLEKAKAGDTIGLLLRGVKKTDVVRGMIITKSSSIKSDEIGRVKTEKVSVASKGMRYVEDVLNLSRYKDNSDSLNSLVNEINNGIVIADFYLPYLCYSDCPPVHYILPDEKGEPVEVLNIAIDPKEYCSNNKSSFLITVSPQGGEVTGESVVNANGGAQFAPSGVDLGGEAQKTVTLTYTKDGQSVTVDIIVFQTPSVAFDIIQEGTSNSVSFTNQSEFSSSFKWEFGDGETSDEKDPSHTYKSEGNYNVTLTAINGVCETKTPKAKLVVIKEEVGQNCQPLGEIDKEYQELRVGLKKGVIEIFNKRFSPYDEEVNTLFKQIREMSSEPIAYQIEVFKKNGTVESLPQWLSMLFELNSQSEIVEPVLRMHKVLTQLALYIDCIQKEDKGKTELDLGTVKDILSRQMKELSVLKKEDPSVYNEPVEKLLNVLKGEQERVNVKLKPEYSKQLDGLFKSLNKK